MPQFEDKCQSLHIRSFDANPSDLPYYPTSPLGLAVAAILVLIPPPGDALATRDDHAIALRRSFAELFARSALESLEDRLGSSSHVDLAKGPRSALHCGIPQGIEPILSLALLSVYEYCQHGNVPKMRIRANQALTIAMDLLLHTEDGQMSCLDARRRCWWSVMFIVYQSSILNASAPVIAFDDLRITTQFPEFRGCREPWPLLVKAQSTLFRSCAIGRQLLQEAHKDAATSPAIWSDIQSLDSYIVELAAEVNRFRCVTNYQGAEADASRNLWAISNALVHTSRLTLHRISAFLDRPIISNEHCDLLAVDTVRLPSRAESQPHLSMGRISEIRALFPFTEHESVRICLHSSLVISRVFRRLPSPNPMYSDTSDVETHQAWPSRRLLASPRSIPIMACCLMQGVCAMSMVLWLVRAATCSGNLNSYIYLLDRPSATTDVQGTERLIEELELGLENLGRSLQADAIFEGMRTMAKEAERLYQSSMVD